MKLKPYELSVKETEQLALMLYTLCYFAPKDSKAYSIFMKYASQDVNHLIKIIKHIYPRWKNVSRYN